jgi:hypothetical protein
MKCISSYFAPAGEERAKPTATDENQNEAITTNLENPSESGIEGQKKNESSGSAGVPAPRKFQQQWSTDTKYMEWLQYDANKQHMTCSFCIKTNLKKSFYDLLHKFLNIYPNKTHSNSNSFIDTNLSTRYGYSPMTQDVLTSLGVRFLLTLTLTSRFGPLSNVAWANMTPCDQFLD